MSTKIVGGGDVHDNQAPFFAQLVLYDEGTGLYGNFCGGSIINDKYILTAAHCLQDEIFSGGWTTDHLHVLVKNPTTNDVYSDEFKKAKGFINHPDYDADNLWINDIAVIELDYIITDNVESVALPQDFGDYSDYDRYYAFGLGLTSSNPEIKPNSLQTGEFEPVDDTECSGMILGFNSDESMCAIGNSYGNGAATCDGDSGGPLTYLDNYGRYHQIGVTSYGAEICEDFSLPSVFAEVVHYAPWIEAQTSSGNPTVYNAELAETEGFHSDGDTKMGVPDPVDPTEPTEPPKKPEPFDPDPNFEPSGGSTGVIGILALLAITFRRRFSTW
ncbi:S1 family peptidase [Vibrio crassostreae]|uniref:S1 family peptidase n=1 Tax=Vibrio crassostreae TaxID=246167 RepID=UPI001B30704F|nr:serine protease [Vibrio crassostreae]